MSKHKKYLIIFIVLVVVLGGAIAALTLLPSGGDPGKTDDGEPIVLAECELSEVSSVKLSPAEGDSFLFEKGGDDSLVIKSHQGLTDNTTNFKYLTAAVTRLTASRVIEEPGDLKDFGLSPAQCSVVITKKDGSKTELDLGANATSGGRYAKLKGDDKLYLLTTDAEVFTYPETAFVSAVIYNSELPQPEAEEAELVRLELGGTMREEPIVIMPNPNVGAEYDPLAYNSNLIVSPYFTGASVAVSENFPVNVATINAASVVEIVRGGTDLTQYGLDNPYATMECAFMHNDLPYSCDLLLGSMNSSGQYYATTKEKKVVYTIDPSKVTWATFGMHELLYPCPVLLNIMQLDSFTYTMPDRTAVFEPVIGVNSDESEYVASGVANGKEISYQAITKLYESYAGLAIDSVTDNEPSGEKLMHVDFAFRDPSAAKPISIDYYVETARTVLVVVNGYDEIPNYIMQRKYFDSFRNKIEAALTGEVVVPSATD